MLEGGTARVSNDQGGLWLSLVERFVRDEEVVGSNPASPTTISARLIREDRCKTW